MKPAIINLSCVACSTPLFAFRQEKAGEMLVESYGHGVRLDPSTPSTAFAICSKCGAETPFDRSLLPAA